MRKILPNSELVSILKCPKCGSSMEIQNGASLICNGIRRHCYDFASSGYINLMPPGYSDSGDSKAAVRARKEFLDLELYRPAAEALAEALSEYLPAGAKVIDAGCGEGYYTAFLAKKGFLTAGADISKSAAEATAKRAAATGVEHGFFCVGSVFELPFADASADAVVNIFAPCAEGEFSRVLRKGGILAVMYAGTDHLMGLKRAIYDVAHENDERADMPKDMKLLEQRRVKFGITVKGNTSVMNLFAMTPYYWRTSASDSEKLRDIEALETEVDMMIAIYQKQ